MSIRLLGGKAKSFSLQVPEQGTRPTSVILRRKIFDSSQDLSGQLFIDCCAGSGAMGFEAWSRGAQRVLLLETSRFVAKILKKNCDLFSSKYNLKAKEVDFSLIDCVKWLGPQLNSEQDFILFFDPPYENHQLYFDFLKKLSSLGPIEGELWLESDEQKGIKLSQLTQLGLVPERHFTHGTSYLCTFSLSDGLNLTF